MDQKLKDKLVALVRAEIDNIDPSHDIHHIMRVLKVAEHIGIDEEADMEVVIPTALFHDLITYSKDDPRNKHATDESAEKAGVLLDKVGDYPKNKIDQVKNCIRAISFSKGENAESIEAKVIQDADMLEATGAISIMRTFSTSGQMNRSFYHPTDPFAKNRSLDDMKYSIDLFYTRLLKVKDKMNTETAKKIANRRTKFLNEFLDELKSELGGK